MFDDGVIKQDAGGQFVPVTNQAEQEHIRAEVQRSKRKQTLAPAETEQILQQLGNDNLDAEDYELE